MSKEKRRKSNKKQLKSKSLILSVLVIVGILVYVANSEESVESEQKSEQQEIQETGTVKVEFPYVLNEGKLEVDSLFQFQGINTDSGNQEGTDIAAIVLKNVSELYLTSANVFLEMADGTRLEFLVTELPAGKQVMAFSTENQILTSDVECIGVSCETSYESGDSKAVNQIQVEVEGVAVTLTNVSGEEVSDLVIYCHNILGEDYLGGVSYKYVVDNIPANESVTVEARDCILGMADVVRMEVR